MGILSMSVAVSSLTLFLGWGGTTYAWNSILISGLGFLTICSSVLFLWAESRARDPIIPLSLFKNRTFNICTALGLLIGVGMFASISYLPTYLQMVYVSPQCKNI